MHSCIKNGIKYAESGPMLEKNEKILAQWQMFEKEYIKRRRCYIKQLKTASKIRKLFQIHHCFPNSTRTHSHVELTTRP